MTLRPLGALGTCSFFIIVLCVSFTLFMYTDSHELDYGISILRALRKASDLAGIWQTRTEQMTFYNLLLLRPRMSFTEQE